MYSDVSIAGDPLALPHLLPPVPQHPGTVAEFSGLIRSIAADRARWAPLVRYDATTRWYARLRTGPGYEVWLLSWLPGQGSGLHDHGDSSGVFTVLSGALRERSLVRRPSAAPFAPAGTAAGTRPETRTGTRTGARTETRTETRTARVLAEGHQRAFAPGYVHEVINDTLEPAVSLHVYFPGLTEMTPHACSAADRPGAERAALAPTSR